MNIKEGGGWLKVVDGGGGGAADNAKRLMALGEGETSVDRWETSVKSCQAEQSILGDKLETSAKSCGQRTQSVVGDSCGRQVRNHADNSIQSGLGDEWREVGDENPV